jgi:hypothetical protein
VPVYLQPKSGTEPFLKEGKRREYSIPFFLFYYQKGGQNS